MDIEQRLDNLEREVKMLESEIGQTLRDIRANLPEKPTDSSRWQKKAWVLALLNILMAVVLFTNVHFYVPGVVTFDINPFLFAWLRALWVALAFIWLLLQMYPLALLLEQEDKAWQGVLWRNATAFFRVNPGWLLLLTAAVLVIALINTIMPAAWLIIALVLVVAIGSIVVRNMIDLYHAGSHAREER